MKQLLLTNYLYRFLVTPGMTIENTIKKALIFEGFFVSVEAPEWSFNVRFCHPLVSSIIPQSNNKSNLLRLSRRGDLHSLPSGDNPDAPLSEFRRQTTTGAFVLSQNIPTLATDYSNNGTVNSGTWSTGKYGKGVNVSGSTGSDISVPDFSY